MWRGWRLGSSKALAALIAAAIGCSAEVKEGAPTTDVARALPVCGARQVVMTDGSCADVGPADPGPEASRLFARSADGWGLSPSAAEGCTGSEMAVLGEASCVAVDPCDRPFPPPDADVVVTTRGAGSPGSVGSGGSAPVAASLQEALDSVKPGGVVAVDSGKWGSNTVRGDVTIVGRCAKDTIIGNGKNNALFVNAAAGRVVVRNVTLIGSSSPIAVQRGTLEAERVILRGSHVAVGAVGKGVKVTVRRSLVEGLGSKDESMGVMVGQGASVAVEESEFRNVSSGAMASDAGSRLALSRSIVSVVAGPAAQSGLAANSGGAIDVSESVIRSRGVRLVAVHADAGTTGGAPSSGTVVVRSSVLDTTGAEAQTAVPVVVADGGRVELGDVTLRHQSPTGILVGPGALKIERTAILGHEAPAPLRAAIMMTGGKLEATGLAVPWAQGIGLSLGGADTSADVKSSLVANVIGRDEAQEAFLATEDATLTIADSEIAGVEGHGIVAIGGSKIAAARTYIHGNKPAPGYRSSALLALNASATLEGSVLEKNGEGVIAAGGAVSLASTSISGHAVALRAMDGMKVVEGAAGLVERTLSIGPGCTFSGNAARVSLEALPELNAPIKLPTL